jgi:hypothetical protein
LSGLWSLAGILNTRVSPLAGKFFLAAVLILMVFSSASAITKAAGRFHRYPNEWENYFQAARWCRSHTPEESICVARKPSLFYLQARRKVLNYPYTSDTAEMMSFFADHQVDYVIADGFTWTGTTRRYLLPAIGEHRDRFLPAHHLKNPDTWVLEIVEGSSPEEGR